MQKLGNDYFREDEVAILENYHLTGYFGGSLMSVAAKMSSWYYGHGLGGLMLVEHYRCYPEIIQFCSELFYNNALVPQRPSAFKDKTNPQPDELPLDYFIVERSRSKEVGTSKTNHVEALAIKKWLDDNSDRLQQRFKDKIGRSMQLANIVTVLTQYEKQALVLKEVIHSETKYKHIRVGTVNTMQGSERPVVLFSSEYGENAKDTAYIDTKTSVFNVAVSRAKNQFILFGCAKHLFGKSNVFKHFKQAFLNQSKNMPDNHVKKSRLSIVGPITPPVQNQPTRSEDIAWWQP